MEYHSNYDLGKEYTFQSPCAGNMFGKLYAKTVQSHNHPNHAVSIPVCGEHVW